MWTVSRASGISRVGGSRTERVGGGNWQTPSGGLARTGGRVLAERGLRCLCPELGRGAGSFRPRGSAHPWPGGGYRLGLLSSGSHHPAVSFSLARAPFLPRLLQRADREPRPQSGFGAPAPFYAGILTLGLRGTERRADRRKDGDPSECLGRKWAGPGCTPTGAARSVASDWFAQSLALGPSPCVSPRGPSMRG